MYYFEIVCTKEKQILGCNYESTALMWMSVIVQAQNYFNQCSSSQFDMSQINRQGNYALLSVEGELQELQDNTHEKKIMIYQESAKEFEQTHQVDWKKLYEHENENIKSATSGGKHQQDMSFLGNNIHEN